MHFEKNGLIPMCRRDDGVDIVQGSRTRTTVHTDLHDERPLTSFCIVSTINAITVVLNVPRFREITPVWLSFKSVIIMIGFVIPAPAVISRCSVEHVAIIATYRNSWIRSELARRSETWRICGIWNGNYFTFLYLSSLCGYFVKQFTPMSVTV